MAYLHIENLYKSQDILLFQKCYALEKIHGTSAHISWQQGRIGFFSGGVSHEAFTQLFSAESLTTKLLERFPYEATSYDPKMDAVTIYGEAYGGSCQRMSPTYGPSLKFVVFDVLVDKNWLTVPQAHEVAQYLGLEFVDYALIPTTLAAIDAERDKPSTQAVRNGITEPKLREGVILRPLIEVITNRDQRIIVKHKRAEFSERTTTSVDLDPTKRYVLNRANQIALEWVTPTRLEHVLDKIIANRPEKTISMSDIPTVITAMLEDVLREAKGEILESAAAKKAISQRTVQLFKIHVTKPINPNSNSII